MNHDSTILYTKITQYPIFCSTFLYSSINYTSLTNVAFHWYPEKKCWHFSYWHHCYTFWHLWWKRIRMTSPRRVKVTKWGRGSVHCVQHETKTEAAAVCFYCRKQRRHSCPPTFCCSRGSRSIAREILFSFELPKAREFYAASVRRRELPWKFVFCYLSFKSIDWYKWLVVTFPGATLGGNNVRGDEQRQK